MQFVHEFLRLDDRCGDTGNVSDLAFYLLSQPLQRGEVVAVDFDGDMGVHAGEHVTNQMSQRLIDLNVYAG